MLLLVLSYAALAMRGFTLGFYGDVVAYQFHYRFDGVIGGMNWLMVEHWQRHLLGALLSAPLHILVPDRYDLWYAFALGLHLMLGLVVFLLVDTLQRGQRRWLAFALALFFVFDTLQTPSNIEFATGSKHRFSFILALLSLWSYVHFVRHRRQLLGWYLLNIATFTLAIMIYEQSFFFFVLHPVIAFVEGRHNGSFRPTPHCLWLTVRDSLLHVMMVAIYVYLLLSLFPGVNNSLRLTPAYILGQMAEGLALLLSPMAIIGRLSLAASMSQVWVIALLALLLCLFFGGWICHTKEESAATPWSPLWMILFGLLLSLLSILNTSPAIWSFAQHARLLYAPSLGVGMIFIGLLAWVVGRNRRIGGVIFALVMAAVLAPGISFLYEYQAVHLAQDKISRQAFQTIFDAIPKFADGAEPYLLLMTDQHAEEALHLHPRDINFPHVFALHYGIRDFRADAVLYEGSGKLQQIKLGDEGIISPLKPKEVIGYDRVVIVSYDSRNHAVTILDRLPNDVLLQGNFEIHADMPMETNWALLPPDRRE